MNNNFEEGEQGHLLMYKPFPFYQEGDKDVYGEIILDEMQYVPDNYVRLGVSISLFNNKMINLELEHEGENALLYFYEFSGEMEISDIHCIHHFFHDWCKYCHRHYPIFKKLKIISIPENEDYKLDGNYFIGEILFSASPTLTQKVAIKIVDDEDGKEIEKLNTIYSRWNDAIEKHENIIRNKDEIKEALTNCFTGSNPNFVKIYNVAQANCIYCNLENKNIFFDIGITRNGEDRKKKIVSDAIAEIVNLNPDAVILSHWDLDHILGVCYNKNCLSNKEWFVPDVEKIYDKAKISASISRLCYYLLECGKSKLYMIDTGELDKKFFISDNKKIKLYLGDIKSVNHINKYNNGGLILLLSNNYRILLPGDCDNSIIHKDIIDTELDYIIIPHHGSNMSKPKYIGTKKEYSTAYLCRGEHPGNCKMDELIEKNYNDCGFINICNTDKCCNKYFEVCL